MIRWWVSAGIVVRGLHQSSRQMVHAQRPDCLHPLIYKASMTYDEALRITHSMGA